MRRVLAPALVVALLATGCAGDPPAPAAGGGPSGEVTVLAAASLTEVFTRLGADFQATRPGTRVTFSFGASSTLARQITTGAAADVFAAASPATMAQVTGASLAAGEPRVFARNQLVIAVPRDNPRRVDALADLAAPRVKVALCDTQVPCGAAAAKALSAAGVAVTPVTLEQDVKATLTKVRLGEVDAALVYRTDVRAAPDVLGIEFPESGQAVNDYPIVALTAGRNSSGGAAFLAYVNSAAAKPALTGAGFGLP
ncbi:MAG TPA: molybdate ABC transporter substrate-binding protein [Catenuloplanes sp.]|jgi:molybdate transport system substrate-binding protein